MFLLAKKWNVSIDPTGYFCSEKLDGHRAIWDGSKFISRGGNVIRAPSWFTKGFPSESLDGELWAGRNNFELVASATKGSRERDWNSVMYAVFDAPEFRGPFELRIQRARDILSCPHGIVIPFWICKGRRHLREKLEEVVKGGGEGLMLRKPGSLYVKSRSDTLLKVKMFFDNEAVIIGHEEGTRPGLCGSLKVMTSDGKIFKVASGMTEDMAHNPPPIGTIITYKYELLTKEGIPRPATFLRIRRDL
jgi:DNA ligase-1